MLTLLEKGHQYTFVQMPKMNIIRNIVSNLFFGILVVVIYFVPTTCENCPEREKCENNKNLLIPACYCDQKCFQYNDCCKEFLDSNNDSNHSVKSTSETCVLLTNYKHQFVKRAGVYMIEKCLGMDEPCNAYDGNLSSLVPVSHGVETYRNADCAICNDVTDYKFWNIIFHVMNDIEIVSKDEELIQNEDVLTKIKDIASTTSLVHFLRPPTGSTPRFCPYDALIKSNDHDDDSNDTDERIQYLNPIGCTGKISKMFRNIDACLTQGCCKSSSFKCVNYNPFYIDDNYDPSDSSRGFIFKAAEIILEFSPPTVGKSDITQVEEMDLSMTYLNMKVNVIVDLVKDNQTESKAFGDCFNAVNVYLQVTKELISVTMPNRVLIISETVRRGYFYFRSTSRQSAQELTQLLHLRRSVICRVGNDGQMLVGTLRSMNKKDGADVVQYKMLKIILTSEYRPTEKRISPLCQNISIGVLNGSGNSKIKLVDLECLDESTLQNVTDSGHIETGAIVTKILVFVVYAWLIIFWD